MAWFVVEISKRLASVCCGQGLRLCVPLETLRAVELEGHYVGCFCEIKPERVVVSDERNSGSLQWDLPLPRQLLTSTLNFLGQRHLFPGRNVSLPSVVFE